MFISIFGAPDELSVIEPSVDVDASAGMPMAAAICSDACGFSDIVPWISSMPEAVARSVPLHEIAAHGSTKASSATTLAMRTIFMNMACVPPWT